MQLHLYNRSFIKQMVRYRDRETRIGEKIQVANGDCPDTILKNTSARFVLLGIPEDIGVRANFGRGGAYSAWQPALNTILNLQSNESLTGEEILLLGHLDFTSEMETVKKLDFRDSEDVKAAREMVAMMDAFIAPVIKTIIASGKEAIVIGGGHNNSYPLLRGAAEGLKQAGKIAGSAIHAVNLDAHSDLRPLEGRHSGNGFSYAIKDGYLHRYAIIGLQEIFNPAVVFKKLNKHRDKIRVFTFDDIYIRNRLTFDEAVCQAAEFVQDNYTGVEIDMDTIQNIPSSARTSCGISPIEARKFVYRMAASGRTAYLHIAEAAPVLSHLKTDLKTGKLIAYLVTDYIKARNEHETTH